MYKRIINDETIKAFTQNLYESNLNDIETINDANDTSSIFLEKFRIMYDKHFPQNKIKPKSAWITAGI